MTEKPILFSGPMVRALLDGRKTQTRRPVTAQPPNDVSPIVVSRYHPIVLDKNGEEEPGPEIFGAYSDDGEWGCKCPYGQPGDRLWVRETHAIVPRTAYARSDGVSQVLRPGDDHDAAIFREGWERSKPGRWRPSIHMPRWASRILLEVTSVRVERLQDISEADAVAEGIQQHDERWGWVTSCKLPDGKRHFDASAYELYRKLWDSLNAARGYGWDVNPWVWVVEFRRVTP